MTNRLNRLCVVATLAIMTAVSIQNTTAQVRPVMTMQYAQQISGSAAPSEAMPVGLVLGFGPLVGYDLSPDAITLGAFLMVHNAIASMPALALLADLAYGIGTENTGSDVSYNTFRVAATALYLVMVMESGLSIYPLAGLEYYRFKWSYSGNSFFPSLSYSDIALIVGVMAMYNSFSVRVHAGLGGGPNVSLTAGHHVGNRKAAN